VPISKWEYHIVSFHCVASIGVRLINIWYEFPANSLCFPLILWLNCRCCRCRPLSAWLRCNAKEKHGGHSYKDYRLFKIWIVGLNSTGLHNLQIPSPLVNAQNTEAESHKCPRATHSESALCSGSIDINTSKTPTIYSLLANGFSPEILFPTTLACSIRDTPTSEPPISYLLIYTNPFCFNRTWSVLSCIKVGLLFMFSPITCQYRQALVFSNSVPLAQITLNGVGVTPEPIGTSNSTT